MRKLLAVLVALLFCISGAMAGEHRGKVKSVDAEKGTITITIKGEDKTFKVADDAEFAARNEKATQRLAKQKLKFKGFSRGPVVTLTTEGEGDKEVVKKVQLGRRKKPKDG